MFTKLRSVLLLILLTLVIWNTGNAFDSNKEGHQIATKYVKLSGTIAVVDEKGVEHKNEDGSFKLTKWRGSGGPSKKIQVIGGKWSTKIPDDVELKVSDIRLGNRLAIYIKDGKHFDKVFPIPESGVLKIRARWCPEPILHVLDYETKDEIGSVELVTRWGGGHEKHPRDYLTHTVCKSQRSPIYLGEYVGKMGITFGKETFFVRSPGYAWKQIEVDFHKGKDYYLKLVPGGHLDVKISDYEGVEKKVLFLTKIGNRYPDYEFKIKQNGTMKIESIEVGRYHVAAEVEKNRRGIFENGTDRLAEDWVEIFPSRITEISVSLHSKQQPEKVPFRGTLIIPKEWEFKEAEMTMSSYGVEYQDTPSWVRFKTDDLSDEYAVNGEFQYRQLIPVESEGLRYTWDAGVVYPGHYEFRVEPLNYDIVFYVSKEGRTDALIEIPEPASMSIKFKYEQIKKPVDVGNILWSINRFRVSGSIMPAGSVSPDRETGLYVFKAPVGSINIGVYREEYQLEEMSGIDLRVNEGQNEYVIEVYRTCGIDLVLKCEGETVTFPYKLWIKVERKDGKNYWRYSVGPHPEGRRMSFRNPGEYFIIVPKIEGYQEIEEQEVVVEKGKYKLHVIELKREK